MRQLQLFHNPSTPWVGATAGAYVGSLLGSFIGAALSLGTILRGATAAEMPAQQRKVGALTNGFAAVGAATGAYIGAAPHQRVAASAGALIGGVSRALLWDATAGHAAFEGVMKRWYVSIPVGLLPTAGAAVGAFGAGPVRVGTLAPMAW